MPHLPEHKTLLPPHRSRELPQSTLHQSPTPLSHLIHAAHQVSKSPQSPSALATPTQLSQRLEIHPRTASLPPTPARSAHNPPPEPLPCVDACFRSNPCAPSRRMLSTF